MSIDLCVCVSVKPDCSTKAKSRARKECVQSMHELQHPCIANDLHESACLCA